MVGLPKWLSSKESACHAGDVSLIPGSEDLLEKEMATHSSIPAWEIPRTEEAGGLQSKEPWRVGHNLATKQQQRHILTGNYTLFTSLVCHIHWEKLRKLKCTCFKLHRDQEDSAEKMILFFEHNVMSYQQTI